MLIALFSSAFIFIIIILFIVVFKKSDKDLTLIYKKFKVTVSFTKGIDIEYNNIEKR